MSSHDVISLTSKKAWQLLQDNPRAMLIDVRSTMEHMFVGHPTGCIHIPWIDEPDWKVNTYFATQVRKALLGGLSCTDEGECVPVILICRSGNRSLDAGLELLRQGIPQVHNVVDGFEGKLDASHHRSTVNGWRFEGLPWQQC